LFITGWWKDGDGVKDMPPAGDVMAALSGETTAHERGPTMFHIIPIRMSLRRGGWVLLTFSLFTSYLAGSTDRLTAPGIGLAPPSNGRSLVALLVEYTLILVCGWLWVHRTWSNWREGGLARPVAETETPAGWLLWTWTMKQALAGVLFLVVGIWLSVALAATVEEERRLIIGVAFALGTVGVQYLLLARRVGKLEQGRGVVYYWQRQPGILDFEGVGILSVPVHAVRW
jgi:hypothetical protein